MKSVWQDSVKLERFPAFSGEMRTNTVIVGGGIAGILTAYFLKEKNIPCILLERGRICDGTTAHTTGKITAGHGIIYSKILNSEGVGAAHAYYSANAEALDKFAALAERIDCDFERRDNFVYSRDDRRKIESEVRALERIGVKAELCERVPLPIETVGAVRLANQAQFNPLKLLSAVSRGLEIYENAHVLDVKDGTVYLGNGRINAENVIITTHFPIIDRRGLYFLKMYQHRSYVLALEGAGPISGMYVDENKRGMSFRGYGDLLLIGGGGHRTGKKGGGYKELHDFVREHYVGAVERYAWAAQDCMTLDGMPYIGRYAKRTSRLYTATGFNKWGMTGAMLSAQLISDMLTDTENDYAEIFTPQRSIFKPQLLINGAETVKNLITPTAPRCTHLGCALKWNPDEHTWDCACHGSRFTENGRLIDSPANKDLD